MKLHLKLLHFFLINVSLISAHGYSSSILGDRLIMMIDNIPYSQLQIESYLNVKEALRDDPSKSQLVNDANWSLALASFIKDMLVYRESTRGSGYRPTKEHIDKTSDRVNKALSQNPRYQERFKTLGINQPQFVEQLGKILTIENYRNSRKLFKNNKKASEDQSTWENQLANQSVVRWFEAGQTYQNLSPL